jgi:hypothetical protein
MLAAVNAPGASLDVTEGPARWVAELTLADVPLLAAPVHAQLKGADR